MNRKAWLVLFMALSLPIFLSAKADGKKESAVKVSDADDDENDVAPESSWGAKLPQAVTVSFWSSKDGEASATKLMTSREVFALSFSMGKEGKEGMMVETGGRIQARADGSFELLLEVSVKGGDASKGAMALELQGSALLKKGQTAMLMGFKEEKFFVRID